MLLRKILPSKGLYCVALVARTGFQHEFFDDLDDVENYALRMDAAGRTVYIAQGSFHTEDNRKQTNVMHMRSFFLDIDCGTGKPYADRAEGAAALREFILESGLPSPLVMSSGNGLYAYWPMTEDVNPAQWKTMGQVLKQVTAAYNFDVDDSRTSDSSSVLRPIGCTNRKPGTPGDGKVSLVRDTEPIDMIEFAKALGDAARKKKLRPTINAAPLPADVFDEFQIYQSVPTSALLIADKCAQIAAIRDTKGNVEEPLWYAAIGLLRYTDEAPAIVHEWSAGHPQYSEADTNAKIKQHEVANMGPTTCTYLHGLNHTACTACPHKNKITSPIVLGRRAPEKLVIDEPDALECPEPYSRTEDGLYYVSDDVPTRFYDTDLYPISIAFDESLGYEVLTLRHKLPLVGEQEFTIRTSLVNDSKALLTILWDNHVHVVGTQEKKIMCAYIESYAQRLQRHKKIGRLLCQMGWKDINDEKAFVLGRKVYYEDRVEDAAMASNIPVAALAFESKGDLPTWVESTNYLGAEGMEPLAFAFLAGAFGAPLMKFTGYDGAMISIMGKSGLGKTLTARWIQSVYGDPDRLMMLRDDTKNSLVSRLGVYGNLPLTIDEVTNIDPRDLSDLVYRVTQGRDKARLTKNAVERSVMNHWNTLAVVSSNASLVEKLSGAKFDSSAELNRLFEFEATACAAFGKEEASDVFRTISGNYGLAGELYIKKLVEDVDKHQSQLDKLSTHIDKASNAEMEERFWIAIVAVAIYGGMLAKQAGLINFDVAPILKWAVKEIRGMRSVKSEMTQDPVGILGTFLDEHASNRLIITQPQGAKTVAIMEGPRGPLYIRVDTHTDRIYISRSKFKDWMVRNSGNFTQLRKELTANGVLLSHTKRKVLGANTHYQGGAQPCLEISMKCPALGQVAAQLVDTPSNITALTTS